MVKITLISLLLLVKIALNIINLGASKESKVYFNAQSIPNKIEYSEALFNMKPRNNALKIISKGDILISEVLFNPRNGGVDFVEIYNNSNHEIDLKELQLANANTAGEPASIKNISLTKLMIAPKTYWVITSNQANIKLNYEAKFPLQFVQLTSLPAYSNDKGSVILLSSNQVVDRLNYNAKIHHPLIQDEDGISIERVSFEVDANDPNNFKSAAATVGFATPTYKNSQEFNGEENFVNLQSKTFSPDGDGFEDFLTLDYQLAENSSLATVNVFSDRGKLVRKLLVNQTIATKGNLNWDGLNDQGTSCGIGIYIVLFDVFDLKGNTKRFKNTCVLAGKLN
ncbi:lamin tail domain-containing protein [Pedobacter fastidiosus]|uniref:Lamin tail domain-containing protein n=1 Tax=Pedobacter fastidiosus TaxID=2765361 RepID=A0ABR7KNK4_9SPHI|nr:lamin tail domain-containing protein [Pedobacter fastidiosus]MBC6109645.1 lamin tail domain-containing protein [Pedobacter fastidiosus]